MLLLWVIDIYEGAAAAAAASHAGPQHPTPGQATHELRIVLTLVDPQDHGREFCLGVVLEEDKYKGGPTGGGVQAARGVALSATGRHHQAARLQDLV